VLSVSALFAQVCYGFIQDKLGLRKNLLWYITALLILSGPAYLLFGYLLKINVLLGSIFGGIYIGLTFNGGIGVLESYTERVARQSQFEFGGRGCGARWAGRWRPFLPDCCLTSIRSLTSSVASCSGLVFFILLARLRVSSAPHAMQEAVSGGKVTLEDALRLLTLPRFWALVFSSSAPASTAFTTSSSRSISHRSSRPCRKAMRCMATSTPSRCSSRRPACSARRGW
jgi:OHS family lactose permease-like MFS transporter